MSPNNEHTQNRATDADTAESLAHQADDYMHGEGADHLSPEVPPPPPPLQGPQGEAQARHRAARRGSRRRRGRGEGGIGQRADGSWYASLSLGARTDQKGKTRRDRRYVYGDSKQAVQKRLRELHAKVEHGSLDDAGRLSVEAFLARWIDTARQSIKPTTCRDYAALLRLHVVPRIGSVALAKLTAAHVETLLADLARDGVSAHVRRQAYAVLHRAMGCAVRWRLVPYNVVNAVDKPRAPKRELQPLDAEEAQTLLTAAAGTRLEALYVLALATGMRQGELLGLRWDDIDFNASALSVRRTLFELDGEMQTGEPKTAKGTRRITLPAFAVSALRAHQEKMLAEGHRSAPVFCDTDGGWLRKSNLIRRSFHPLLKQARLRRLRFHDLRHSAATLLLLSGVHPKVVQERLGHATIGVTMDTYSHVLPTMQLEAAARLDGMFTKKAR